MPIFRETPIIAAQVGEVLVNTRSRTASLTFNGKVLTASLGSPSAPLRCPHNYGTYDKEPSQRVNLSFEVDAELGEWIAAVEHAVLEEATKQSFRLFTRTLTREEVERDFNSSLKKSVLRAKMNISGIRAVRCWNSTGEQWPLPKDLRGMSVTPLVEVRALWFAAGRFGIVWELTDMLVEQTVTKNPWA